jgi:redox-sensitive bicupin YhaK (pirin superfamily)
LTENDEKRANDSAVELAIGPRYRDLVGFRINRVWPTARRRLIGPFIFYDHMTARELPPGEGLDVPPHPHIGLATVTYLFSGEIMHRDSLGTEQVIRPGDLNWMIAGEGITHSERTSDAYREARSVLHGTQAWVALPLARESGPADFIHVGANELPERIIDGVRVRLIAGSGFAMTSPLKGDTPLHYAEAHFSAGGALELDRALGQRAAYIVSGELRCDGVRLDQGRLFVFNDLAAVRLTAAADAHVMLLGGAPLPEGRLVWWNFVASTQQQIDAARQRWADGAFPSVPGDSGHMDMPAW